MTSKNNRSILKVKPKIEHKDQIVNELSLVQLIFNILKVKPKIEHKDQIVNELKRNIADLTKIRKLRFKTTKSLENFVKNDLLNV